MKSIFGRGTLLTGLLALTCAAGCGAPEASLPGGDGTSSGIGAADAGAPIVVLVDGGGAYRADAGPSDDASPPETAPGLDAGAQADGNAVVPIASSDAGNTANAHVPMPPPDAGSAPGTAPQTVAPTVVSQTPVVADAGAALLEDCGVAPQAAVNTPTPSSVTPPVTTAPATTPPATTPPATTPPATTPPAMTPPAPMPPVSTRPAPPSPPNPPAPNPPTASSPTGCDDAGASAADEPTKTPPSAKKAKSSGSDDDDSPDRGDKDDRGDG